jgi:hypothetical membrane protein
MEEDDQGRAQAGSSRVVTTAQPSVTGGAPMPPGARRSFGIAAGLVVLYLVLDVIAQLLPPHYSPVTQAESDLAVGPYGAVMTVNFVVRGLLTLAFLNGLRQTIRAEGGSWVPYRRGVAAFLVWGVGAFLLAIFPTDVPSTPLSWHGTIHLVVAVLAFLGGALGTYWVATRFGTSPTFRSAEGWATGLAWAAIVLVALELLGGIADHRLAGDVGGLLERLFLGAVLLWLFLVSVYALRVRPSLPSSTGSSPSGA